MHLRRDSLPRICLAVSKAALRLVQTGQTGRLLWSCRYTPSDVPVTPVSASNPVAIHHTPSNVDSDLQKCKKDAAALQHW